MAISTYIIKWANENKERLKEFFNNIWNKFKETFLPTESWVWKNVISPIIGFYKPIIDAILTVVKTIWNNLSEIVVGIGKAIWSVISKVIEIEMKIIEIFVALGKAFYNNVISPILSFISPLVTWIYNTFIKPTVDKFIWLKDRIVSIFKAIGPTVINFVAGAFKSIINAVLSSVENKINKFIKMINKAIDIVNKIPGVSKISKITELSIPRLQGGGFPQGEDGLFYANHNEMVGKFTNGKTAVANNDQIVEGIQAGVFSGMMSALRNTEFGGGDVVIEATGDTEGLLNFISFKQKQKDRQFN